MWWDGVLWRKKQLSHTCLRSGLLTEYYAISIESTYTPVIIIGVYLPTTNSPLEEYRECLDVIECLINRHPGWPVIITGDFNAHVGTEGGARGRGEMNIQGEFLMDLICTSLHLAASPLVHRIARGLPHRVWGFRAMWKPPWLYTRPQ